MELNRVGFHYAISPEGATKCPMFDESGLDWIVASMRELIDDGYDAPFVVTGQRRNGKSVFTLKVSRKQNPAFGVKNIHFSIESFMADLENIPEADPRIKYYPTVDYDESITGLHNQEWQSQVPYVKVLNIIGKKRITMPVVLPHIGDLNPKVTRMMAFWVFIYQRGVAEIRIPRTNQFDRSIFWVPYCAIQYDKFEDNDPFWVAYSERKDKFISEYTKSMSDTEGTKGLAGKYAEQRNTLIEHLRENKIMSRDDIAEVLKVKPGTLDVWRARSKSGQSVKVVD
jgi:DNA-binding transcriptional regulator YiaG